MIYVIPFLSHETESVLNVLEMCKARGEQHSATCLIVCPEHHPIEAVHSVAKSVFSSVKHLHLPNVKRISPGKIEQTNYVWQTVARHIYTTYSMEPWFWLQSITPLKSDWCEQLEKAYQKCGKQFMFAEDSISPIGVYPHNAAGQFPGALRASSTPFALSIGKDSVAQLNGLVQHDGDKLTDKMVVYHGERYGRLAREIYDDIPVAPRIPAMVDPLYRHSGSGGDIIYALACIKAKGGGRLTLTETELPRTRMNADTFRYMEPLISLQPYIKALTHQAKGPFDYDLDQFRHGLRHGYEYGRTILDYTAMQCGAKVDDKAWLTVDVPIHVKDKPVVINRTLRYQNHKFPWREIANKYRNQAVFLGLEMEYEMMKFQFDWPELIWLPTRHLLECARLIAGSELFIANQSSMYAVAEGLKKQVIQETFLLQPDCLFWRDGATMGFDSDVFLPDL